LFEPIESRLIQRPIIAAAKYTTIHEPWVHRKNFCTHGMSSDDRTGPEKLDKRIRDSLAFKTGRASSLNGSKSMARRKRRNHSPAFKAQGALAALKGDKTLAERAQQHDIHPNQITEWKTQLLERAAQVFDGGAKPAAEPDLQRLHAKIGQMTLENDFLEGALTQAGLLSARR
jgi:transposase-like protein